MGKTKVVTLHVDVEIWNKLKEYADTRQVGYSKLARIALKAYITGLESNKPRTAGVSLGKGMAYILDIPKES